MQRFLELSSKYKYLCSLQEENIDIPRLTKCKVKKGYENSYTIYIDNEDGTLIFAHATQIAIGAAYTSNVEYDVVIQFDTLKALLAYEIGYYKSLISKWENENDLDRANLCKEYLQKLEIIADTDPKKWRSLINECD